MKKSPLIRRTGLRRTSPHRPWRRAEDDKVSPAEAAHVLARDNGCIAPQVDPASGPCAGRIELDHVKDETRLGDRAKSDRWHLVSVCEGHSEKGMKAGHQWNTASRALEREYLLRVEPR
jgi:hypothetical protein